MPVRCWIHSSEVSTVFGKFFVGDDTLRQIGTATLDDRTNHALPPVACSDAAGVSGAEVTSSQPGQALDQLALVFVADHVDRHADGVGEAQRIRAAVALHADPVEAQEYAAIVAARIDPLAQLRPGAGGEQIADLGEGRGAEGVADELCVELGRALDRLQRDVAGEAVGDDDVDDAGTDVVALDEAVEEDRRALAAQHGRGLTQLLVALQFLGADVQQADPRLVEA